MKTTEANMNKIPKLYFFPCFHKLLKLNIHNGTVTMSITFPFHIPSQFTFTMSTIDTYLKILNLSYLISNRFSLSSTTKVQHQSDKFVFSCSDFHQSYQKWPVHSWLLSSFDFWSNSPVGHIKNSFKTNLKGCVCYIFASLVFRPTREHLWNL